MTKRFGYTAFLTGALCVVALSASGSARQVAVKTPEPVPDVTHTPAEFSGVWDYNADESVNAATGRPEQNPRSATQRGRGAGAAGAARGGTGGRRGGGAPSGGTGPSGSGGTGGTSSYGPSNSPGSGVYGGGYGGEGGPLSVGMSAAMMEESRDLPRDLLEVPESLKIALTSIGVVLTDDLDRSRTYPTDGTKHKYLLGASEFEAKVTWDGSQLKRDIQGAYGFHLTETYFLSPDGQRLFVIIRVGDPKQPAKTKDGRPVPVVGVNRVYDRINP